MSPKRPAFLGHGRYELLEPVGSGGMATVLKARDLELDELCAVKLLLPSAARSTKIRRRFLAEATTMAALDHPNVVRVLSVGQDDGHYYFVMELAHGGSIADYLRRFGARSPRESLALIFQVLLGLEYAHTAGVVHRDVKPHNMLLQDLPELHVHEEPVLGAAKQVVKLTDFGIAKHMAGGGARITGTGDTLGTLAYMAPEQRTDPRNAQAEADIYGVGATLYMMVSGRRPFDLALPESHDAAIARMPEALRPVVEIATRTAPEGIFLI